MRLFLLTLTLCLFSFCMAQTDEDQILEQAKLFSENLVQGDLEKVVAMYTEDAKIFPNNREILSGEDLAKYWNPSEPSKWKTTYHKIDPVEVKIWGDEAYDYGYYEGTSSDGNQESNWKGKYVIIWRKESGVWKIYLDIWNRIE